jgi:hypothetical protein
MVIKNRKDGDSSEHIRAHEFIREEVARKLGLDPDNSLRRKFQSVTPM